MRGPYRGEAAVASKGATSPKLRLAAVLAATLVTCAFGGFACTRVVDGILTPPVYQGPGFLTPMSSGTPSFDEERIRGELQAVDVTSCARPGGPAGPGFVLIELDPDRKDPRVMCSASGAKIVAYGASPGPAFSARYADTDVGRCLTARYASAKLSPFQAEGTMPSVVVPFVVPVDGRPFDGAEALATLRLVSLRECPAHGQGELDVSFLPSGAVRARAVTGLSSIMTEGRSAGGRTPPPLDFLMRCVERSFSRTKVTPFTGSEVSVRWPYRT